MKDAIKQIKEKTGGHDKCVFVYPRGKAVIMSWSELEEFIVPESLAKMMDMECPWEQAEFDNVPAIEIDDKILEKVCKAESTDNKDIEVFRDCYSRGKCKGWLLPDKSKLVVCDGWE